MQNLGLIIMAICVSVGPGDAVILAGDAIYLNNVFSCSSGQYLLLSPIEMNAVSSSPFVAGPEHYAAVSLVFGSALTALALIWGLKRVLKLFMSHTES